MDIQKLQEQNVKMKGTLHEALTHLKNSLQFFSINTSESEEYVNDAFVSIQRTLDEIGELEVEKKGEDIF